MWSKIKKFFNRPLVLTEKMEVKKPEIVIKDLQKKTKKELESIGRKVGIELDRRLTKAKLISQIKKAHRK